MRVTSFGEILWDDFPDGKVLGGAPLNLVVRLRALGADSAMISRRGDDDDGRELVRQIEEKGVSCDLIQTDTQQATSLVKVKLNAQGSASYDIVYPCAWDKIEAQEAAVVRVAASDAFIYGSLSTRDEVSRASLAVLLTQARYKIFDVNLRPPHFDLNRVLEMMKQADLVKMNDDELYDLAAAFGSPYHSVEQNVRFLADLSNAKQICITLGGHGAMYYQDGRFFHHSGYRVKVADTVGSGDSFLAGLTYKLLNNASPQEALAFACALGALVASHHGATPEISLQQINDFMHPA